MLKVGLTGGIGSGKSTVAQLFKAEGMPIIDADLIARQLVAIGQPALEEIIQTFGTAILHQDGSLNRNQLKNIIFSDPEKKQQLEAILHPRIYAQIEQQLVVLNAPYCIICIPLLTETKKQALVDRVLLIDCPLEQQIKRVGNRDQLTESQIHAIINTQASKTQQLAIANDVIDNSKTLAQLAEQVKNLHNSYLLLSSPA
jgi:dephospho-CoA kinase